MNGVRLGEKHGRVNFDRRCHDLVVRQAHHEVYLSCGAPVVDLILSLSKDEVVALSQEGPDHRHLAMGWQYHRLEPRLGQPIQ
jgi:hypothetical protein